MQRRGRVERGVWMVAVLGLLGPGCVLVTGDDDDGAGDTGSLDAGTDAADDTGGSEIDVPSSPYCDPVASWPAQSADFEQQVLALVNDARSQARTCGNQGFEAAAPLTMEPRLRCAARKHSLDMVTRGFFSHDNPDGQSPFDRMELAGYEFLAAGENIAAGQPDPASVVQGWLESPGHCSNIMSGDFEELGVGHVASDTAEFPHYWTQVFGTPL